MTFRRLSLLILTAALGISLAGCDVIGSDSNDCSIRGNGVVFANQGIFQSNENDGSVGFYNSTFDEVTCESIGEFNSIVQSISVQENTLYATANNAGRLDIYDLPNTSQIGKLTGLVGPRYLTLPDDNTVFLTDQQPFNSSDPDSIRAIGLNDSSPTITASIAVSGTVAGITHTTDRVYAALGGFGVNPKVAILNEDNATLEEEIDIGCTSRFVLADEQDEVFALCNNATTGEAVVLDGRRIQKRISLSDSVETTGAFGQDAYYAPTTEELYVVIGKEQVVRIDTRSNKKSAKITPKGSGPIGAVGYNSQNERLYVGRADPSAPFEAKGTIIIHNRDGEKIGTFTAGIFPDFIDFRRVDE